MDDSMATIKHIDSLLSIVSTDEKFSVKVSEKVKNLE